MPGSVLPTENSLDKAVQEFGIGTYDVPFSQNDHGEDSEDLPSEMHPHGKSLPDDGGSLDPFGPDRLLSYPATYSSVELPGDYEIPPPSRRINDDTIDSVVHSESQAKLPNDSDNPSARSDYYDGMTIGQDTESVGDTYWADEDTGAWASEGDETLPGVLKNDVNSDDSLGALGNYWSGNILEDVTGPYGFPSTELSENADFPRSDRDDGGRVMASENIGMKKQATNINLVTSLTGEFLKEFGKKDLTRRHVMAFLQKRGQPQFLASDMIRCLKLSHSVYVKDVLDEFPVIKTASMQSLDSLTDKIADFAVLYRHDTDTFRTLRACAADISIVTGLWDKVRRNS